MKGDILVKCLKDNLESNKFDNEVIKFILTPYIQGLLIDNDVIGDDDSIKLSRCSFNGFRLVLSDKFVSSSVSLFEDVTNIEKLLQSNLDEFLTVVNYTLSASGIGIKIKWG